LITLAQILRRVPNVVVIALPGGQRLGFGSCEVGRIWVNFQGDWTNVSPSCRFLGVGVSIIRSHNWPKPCLPRFFVICGFLPEAARTGGSITRSLHALFCPLKTFAIARQLMRPWAQRGSGCGRSHSGRAMCVLHLFLRPVWLMHHAAPPRLPCGAENDGFLRRYFSTASLCRTLLQGDLAPLLDPRFWPSKCQTGEHFPKGREGRGGFILSS